MYDINYSPYLSIFTVKYVLKMSDLSLYKISTTPLFTILVISHGFLMINFLLTSIILNHLIYVKVKIKIMSKQVV